MDIPKFNIRTVDGDEIYTRVNGVNCAFTDGRVPEMFFSREDKMTSASGHMVQYQPLPALTARYEPGKSFPVLNPLTGQTTQMSYDEFLWIFYQLWISVENEAQAAAAEAENPTETPTPGGV